MNQKSEFLEELCMDEAVCFIADRHHVSPSQLLNYFLGEEAPSGKWELANSPIALESNEIEILKGLSGLE